MESGDSSKSKGVQFYVTGFGTFGTVTQNPTQLLAQSLTETDKQSLNIRDVRVLEVSREAVDSYYSERAREFDEESQSGQESASRVFIHCGVHSGSKRFALEHKAYNLADFRIPDINGN